MTTASLEFCDRTTAQPGIEVVRLHLHLRCNANPGPTSGATPYVLQGDVTLETTNRSHYLAPCRSKRPFWFRKGNVGDVTVCLDVTAEQLEVIEDLRQGADLTLRVDFTAAALVPTEMSAAVLDGHQARLWISATEWCDVLTQAGVAERLLLIVPAPPASAERAVREAWADWQAARRAVEGGRWRDAVATSRRVIELLGMKVEPTTPATERSKGERWQSVGAAIWRLTSAAHHADDTTIEMEWSREEAVAAVAHAGALLKAILPPLKP